MIFATAINFNALMQPAATRLLGEPNRRHSRPPKDVRWGNNGSLSVNFETGQFFDHEAGIGGGVVDLVRHKMGCDRGGAIAWLRREGLLPEHPSREDIPPESKPTGSKPRFVCAYDYVNEDGVMLHQTVRYDSKRFRQRQPHPEKHGEWIWNLEGIRTVLYQLPDLLKAIANGDTIYVVEGEKDADSLRALGLTATCNPMGAGKWRPEFSETLRGADVVIVADNDDPGRKHAEQVAESLYGVAKRVRVLDLAVAWPECPGKGDVSDFIGAGGNADGISSLISQLAAWRPAGSWPEMPEEALYGLPGEVVRVLDPHTEADPNAILLQFLIMVGNAIGRGPYYQIEGDRHYLKLFGVLVGQTSKGRKGISAGRVRQILKLADPKWETDNINSGLSSGEGLIFHVRDPVTKINKDGEEEIIDAGVTDKRLMLQVEEFAGALAAASRPGNTLSPVIRDAWGPNRLQTLVKNSPNRATDSHVSIIAHVTEQELRETLTRVEMGNGFANRFLFAKVRRSKFLPHGGDLSLEAIGTLGAKVKEAIQRARAITQVTMAPSAAAAWESAYRELSAERPGLIGAVLGRAEAQVIRVAILYAVLDGSKTIELPHLRAATAVWEFSEESAKQIFGDSLGNPVADTILAALRGAGTAGKSRAEISDLFGRHQTSSQLREALNLLLQCGKARFKTVKGQGPGRSTEVWFAVAGA